MFGGKDNKHTEDLYPMTLYRQLTERSLRSHMITVGFTECRGTGEVQDSGGVFLYGLNIGHDYGERKGRADS